MEDMKSRIRVGFMIGLTALITVAGLYGLLKPIQNGCSMTYMYPTYIPVSSPKNLSSSRYGLYLYHEGWKKIDFDAHLKQLHGVPVLFIPGNAGSYKQVRSVAKESYWAYTNGPLERSYYQEASLSPAEVGVDVDEVKFFPPNQYTSMLDWFTIDLEEEYSAMDWRIIEEHAEYVVYAIHRILDQYKESFNIRVKEGAAIFGKLPTSVILVGHSMGGFVARAATVHPNLRESSIETIITLSSPHQSPPIPLQPSLCYYYASMNQRWREGYEMKAPGFGLSNVILISISGGINDYQVRSKSETLDGIVPPTHGFMISSTEMNNVWLSIDHQSILWCNLLTVQVSHTLLSLVDPETGHPFSDRKKRLVVFTKMLRSGFQHVRSLIGEAALHTHSGTDVQPQPLSACPHKVHWNMDNLEKDLYIQTTTVTVLAMDGRRRRLDIDKLGSYGKSHFLLVTNLSPCSGVRIHLWSGEGKVEVTTKMTQISCGPPAPKQIEPRSQIEHPAPSAVLWLSPEQMKGFKFITISVAPRLTVSRRPPPAASMAVGQFLNVEEGVTKLSAASILISAFSPKEISLKEDHPIALKLAFTINLGLLPVTLSLKTAGCGIKILEQNSRLCKLRCFPAVALAWDETSGLHVYPNLNSETIVVDSAPARWDSVEGSEKTAVLLLVDPHCAYKISFVVSFSAAASRFLLLYNCKIAGLAIAVVFFALMRQARAWEFGMRVPPLITAIEYNMILPFPFLLIAAIPMIFLLLLSVLWSHPIPSPSSFFLVSLACYAVANGFVIVLVLVTQLLFHLAALIHVFIKKRCLDREWFVNLTSRIYAFKVMRLVRSNPVLVTALLAVVLVCFVHPALGLSVMLISHTLCCHAALCSYYGAQNHVDLNFSSLESGDSFGDTQLEIFHRRHGMFILHFLAMVMFVPSLLTWFQSQRLGAVQFRWFLDSVLCIGVILHAASDQKPGVNGREIRLSFVYMLGGLLSFVLGLTLAPHRVFYIMAAIGARLIHSFYVSRSQLMSPPVFPHLCRRNE